MAFNAVVTGDPALLCPAYVSIKRHDKTVNPFAMQTAFPPSDYYELIRLPVHHRSPRFLLSSPTRFFFFFNNSEKKKFGNTLDLTSSCEHLYSHATA